MPTTAFEPTNAAEVSVIIATHNRRADLERTIEGLHVQTFCTNRALEIIVVDNGSTDGTEEWVTSRRGLGHSPVRYVRTQPAGPASARNLGASLAGGALLLFLDSDVVLDARWIELTVEFLERHSKAAIVGGKLLYASRSDMINSFGGVMGQIGLAWDDHEGSLSAPLGAVRQCLWVSSAALLVRRELFMRMGGFDETFFYAYEESDLGWRANLTGNEVFAIPDALAYHYVGNPTRSENCFVFHYCKNRLRSLLKNLGPGRLFPSVALYLMYAVTDGVCRPPRQPKLAAISWNMRNWANTLRERARVQGTRTRTDREIAWLFSRRWFPPVPLNGGRRRPMVTGPPNGCHETKASRAGRVETVADAVQGRGSE